MRTGQIERLVEVRQASHYPQVNRPVVAMAKAFPSDTRTGRHTHERCQLLFAVNGLMVATTDAGTWLVPQGHALWIPAGLAHDVAMYGDVSMRTAYISADLVSLLRDCRVIEVSPLLKATLSALAGEPPDYDEHGRGGNLANLLLDEIERTPLTALALPTPIDPRLAKATSALVADPGRPWTIDQWSDFACMSRRSFTRRFRNQTGLAFGEWRRRLRVLTAITRVADGAPPGRVAADLGYGSTAAFKAMSRRELSRVRVHSEPRNEV
jgi:AraC-like DNA-binding protein/mannose-6-phosphate isomerase-like protein (cupin superfamily)